MRLTLAAAAATALAACGSTAPDDRQPAAEDAVAALEKQVPLPDASRALAGYQRYYAVSEDRIEGVYLSSRSGPGRVHLVDRRELPQAAGEGCSVVKLTFQRTDGRFGQILCNEARLPERRPAPEAAARPRSKGERG